jgi:hypothetical protein
MNTLLFKIGTLIFLGGSTLAAFLFSGICPKGKSCDFKARTVAAATAEQSAEPAALSDHCAKMKAESAAVSCAKTAKKARSGCPYSKSADTQVAQNSEPAQSPSADSSANR